MNVRDVFTEAEKAFILEKQGGGCAICGRKAVNRALNMDHDHKIAQTKVIIKMAVPGEWVAVEQRWLTKFTGASRAVVSRLAEKWLLRRSFRGMICWYCNQGLQKFWDKSKSLRAAGDYLDKFQSTLL